MLLKDIPLRPSHRTFIRTCASHSRETSRHFDISFCICYVSQPSARNILKIVADSVFLHFYRRLSSTALHSNFCHRSHFHISVWSPSKNAPSSYWGSERRLTTLQRQIRSNLHVFARYRHGIYPERRISWGNRPSTAGSETGPEKFLEQNWDTQQHTVIFKFIISLLF